MVLISVRSLPVFSVHTSLKMISPLIPRLNNLNIVDLVAAYLGIVLLSDIVCSEECE